MLRWNRPVATPRRRPFSFLLLLLLAGFGLLGLLRLDLPPPPSFSVPATRAAAQHAVRTLRPDLPAGARLIEQLVAQAEVATAQEIAAPPWRRSAGRAATAWQRVHAEARSGLAVVRGRRQNAAARWAELEPAMLRQVRQAELEAGESGVSAREIAAARKATYHALLAGRYAAAGELDRANTAAMTAMDFSEIVHKAWRELHARFGEARNLALWRSWVEETVAQSRRDQEHAIIVDKLKRKLYVFYAGSRIATLDAELGAKGLRQKMHSGDQATPEGRYRVVQLKSGRRTIYYKALLINYPNDADRARHAFAKKTGQAPPRSHPGNLIEIHGDGGQGRDWTDGCVALANQDMDYVFARSRVGTPVTIVGTF
ncbi:MAG TPA: L,D-transpeptidase family protein [Thermoanaerobaculia bacterium]|nr:L,D-transpeptidase family protein [Thermoanaerobaculia bacterium]